MVKPKGNEETNFVHLWEEHFREMNSKYKYPTDQMRLVTGEKYYKIPSGSWESRCWRNGPGRVWKSHMYGRVFQTQQEQYRKEKLYGVSRQLGSGSSRIPLSLIQRNTEMAGELDSKGLIARDEKNLAVTRLNQQLRTR